MSHLFMRTDETRKAKLLRWVQDMVPRVCVEDFITSWHDGVALCFLMEEVSPGLCPRPELLKPHHRVNNCRLGIKLAQKYLSLPKMMITAEEMAIADADTELKIMHLLQLIKWRYQRQKPRIPVSPHYQTQTQAAPEPVKVIARGTGLKAGIVGRRAKFNILTESASYLDLHIEIQGPNNELNSERITSVNHGYERRSPHSRSPGGYAAHAEEDSRIKFIEDDVGNMFLRQKSIDEDLHQNVIPFDYQCVGEGRFLVTYIPRSSGTYFISIKSQDVDIEGSPFEVKISDWMSSWNVMPKPRVMSFDMLPSIEETPIRERSVSPCSEEEKKDSRRNSGRNRIAQVSKQLTIMKKRVLKRVITRNGEEILLTPSPTLSRQSSADISDFSEDDQSGKTDGKRKRTERSPGRRSPSPCPSPGRRSPCPSPGRRSPCPSLGRRSPSPCLGRRSPASGNGNGGHQDRPLNSDNDTGKRVEDFANNSCNITLHVTSFEDEEEEKRKQKSATMRIRSISPVNELLRSPAAEHLTPRYVSLNQESSSQGTQAQVDNIPRSPRQRQRLRADAQVDRTDVESTEMYGNAKPGDKDHADTSQSLLVVNQNESPSTSDEASGTNGSEVTDFSLSPRVKDFAHDFGDGAQEQEHGRTFCRTPSNPEENRRRFEESLSQRDNDADDSDSCSQLVSALTEFKPASAVTKKLVGRSYSDGSRVAPAKERHFIRLTRLDGQGGDCFWSSGSSVDRESVNNASSSSSWNALRTKVVQSNSLRKTCMYLQDRALDHSMSDNSAGSSDCPPFHEPSQELSPEHVTKARALSSEGDEGGALEDSRRDRLAKFQRQWRTVDADVGRQSSDDFERGADWRYTLQGKRSHSFSAPGRFYDDEIDLKSFRPFDYSSSMHLENMSILDKLNDDDEILEVVIESTEPPEPRPESVLSESVHEDDDFETGSCSEDSLQSAHAKQKLKGSLARQNRLPNKSSSDASADRSRSRTTSAETSTSQTDTSTSQADEFDSRMFRTIQKQRRKSREGSVSVSIVVPKAKTSKSTQVTYEEIKAETGWKKPAPKLHKRKKYVYAENTDQNALSRSKAGETFLRNSKPRVSAEETASVARVNRRNATSRNLTGESRGSCEALTSGREERLLRTNGDSNQRARFPNRLKRNETANSAQKDRDSRGANLDQSLERETTVVRKGSHIPNEDRMMSGRSPDVEKRNPAPTGKAEDSRDVRTKPDPDYDQNPNTSHEASDIRDGRSSGGGGRKGGHSSGDSRCLPARARSEPVIRNPDGSQDPFHDRGDCRRKYGSRADHVLEWMQRAARADHMHPERQSTQDTLDSGIENESPSYNSFVSGHRRIHRRPYPWSIDLDPSLIRGSNSSLTHSDSFPTHRRIARRSYPWEIELDPRLVRGSSSSISTDGTPEDRFQLTLGVIEAAVHRTVNRILSGSSVSSAGTRTHLEPSFSNKGGGSFSDSELNCNNAASSEKRKKARRKQKETGADGSFSQNTGSFRSLALLSNDLTIMRVHSQSPDIAETKSDGQYSPYSVTDIPCFELPSDAAKIREDASGAVKNVQSFPHQRPKLSRLQPKGHTEPKKPDSAFQLKALTPQLVSQQEKGSRNPLFLRRQGGNSAKSPSTASAALDVESPLRGSNSRSKKNATKGPFLAVDHDAESDTNTSEDSFFATFRPQAPASRKLGSGIDATLDARPTTSDAPGEVNSTPKIVIHHPARRQDPASSTSTDDSYCGFGISRHQRDDLIGHLHGFRGLTEFQKLSSPDGSRGELSPTSLRDVTAGSPSHLTSYSDPFDDSSPVSPASLFASNAFFSEANLENFDGSDCNENFGVASDSKWDTNAKDEEGKGRGHTNMSLSPLQAQIAHACRGDHHGDADVISGATSGEGEEKDKTGQCSAYGPGLSYGQVGAKNNFQVWTERPGNGCVTVAVFGPRSHCVTETSVTYIGDNVYDVTYCVTSPGYYVIVVKWGEKNLPDSPYICKVTY